jgi:hypothetical protein
VLAIQLPRRFFRLQVGRSDLAASVVNTDAPKRFVVSQPVDVTDARWLTTKLTCPARTGELQVSKKLMRAGSGAAPGSACLCCS